ncbi:MAG: hypothetical protein U0441_12020 [Polyangiaceae bacterium]
MRTSILSGPAPAPLGLVAAGASLVFVTGCTPPPPPKVEAPPPKIAVAPTATEEPAPPALDLSPAPEPEGLIGVIRIGAPYRDLLMLRDLLPAHTSIGKLLAPGPDTLASIVFGSLAPEVDLNANIDMALLRPDKLVASVAIRDLGALQKAGAADFDFRAQPQGRFAVVPKKRGKHIGFLGELACALHPGGDPVRYHLVCSPDPNDVAATAPYLARTVTASPMGPGVRLEAATSHADEKLAKFLTSPANTSKDTPFERTTEGWLTALAKDYAGSRVELQQSGGSYWLTAELRFRSVTSPLSTIALLAPGGTPPAQLWHVPKDADLALAIPGTTATEIQQRLGATFWSDLRAAAAEDARPEFADGTIAELKKLLFTGGPLVFAHGPGTVPPEDAKPNKDAKKAFTKTRETLGGWVLLAGPEPVTRWTDGIRALLKLDAEESKAKKAKKPAAKPDAAEPGESDADKSNLDDPTKRRVNSHWSEIALRATDKLPKGALHLLLHQVANPKYVPKGDSTPLLAPVDTHVFIAGTDATTWALVSPNEALALSRLREALSGVEGIGARADLTPLRMLPTSAPGFVTLRGLVDLFAEDDAASDQADHIATLRAVKSLPAAGTDPIFLSYATNRTGDQGATLTLSAQFPPTAAFDVVRFIQNH